MAKSRAKVKEFTRPVLRELRDELEDELAAFGKRRGVSIGVGAASFTAANVTFKLELATVNADGSANNKDAENFRNYAKSFGLEPDDFDKTFRQRSSTYTICGLKPRSRKYPILARNQNGKVYKFPASTVLRGLGRKVPSHLNGFDDDLMF